MTGNHTAPRGLAVFVTVGMGPWPFDRLLAALPEVCARHDVFVQTGTSTLTPPCPHAAFLGYEETQRRIAEADVVITHAGNTVRLVQRLGKIPIAVAREAARGEMRNDHQVTYLQRRDRSWPGGGPRGRPRRPGGRSLRHPEREQTLLLSGVSLSPVDGTKVADLLDAVATQDDISRRWDSE